MNRIALGRRTLVTALAFLVVSSIAGCSNRKAEEARKAGYEPPLPYFDWGACPFECCTYRQWTTNAAVSTYKDVGSRSMVGNIAAGDSVLGMTGVVITKRPGHAIALGAFSLGDNNPVAMKPGDRFLVLHDLGEGSSLMWFKGQVLRGPIEGGPGAPFQVMDRPVAEWWVKVRDRSGGIGWTKETSKFDHMDACE